MELQIKFDDRTEKSVEIKPADIVAFERHYNISFDSTTVTPEQEKAGVRPANEPKIEYTFFLAWNALRRTSDDKENFPTFDDWLDTAVDLDSPELPDPLG